MSQEVAAEIDTASAAPEPTAVTEASPVEQQGTEPEVEQQTKTFTQEELDAIVRKRLDREQRKWERQRAQQPVAEQPKQLPSAEQFESTEAYAEALAVQKAEQLLAQREMHKQHTELLEAYHDREEQAREKYDDFEQVAYNPKLPITTVMADTIRASDVGPEVAYYLGTNVKETERIARLPPILQAKEIGKIEAKLADNPPVKRSTSAPAPITPVTARSGNNNPSYDTTDPRSIKNMSTSEWIEAERARQMRKMQAQANR
jgi:hypothetical protein